MVETVLAAVMQTLADCGVDCALQYRDEEIPRGGALVCVGLRSGKLLGSGAGEYLGVETDADTGAQREKYGFRAEMSIALDIYAESAQECRDGFGEVTGALGALPKSLKGRTLECGELVFDSTAQLFRLPTELECIAYLCAERDEDAEEFTDFTLRGVLK